MNPKAKCQNYRFNVLDDYSFNLYNLLSCDLVISTIDDQEAKHAIDSTLVPYGKKVLYSGAFYNSVAGFVQGTVRSLQGLNMPETQKNKGFQQHLWLL
ncbi:MAG: hypothetical protein AB1420_17200 [Bacillota bacterium]